MPRKVRRKRIASRGSVNNIILEALNESDKYGYEIIKQVEEKTNGEIKLKQIIFILLMMTFYLIKIDYMSLLN